MYSGLEGKICLCALGSRRCKDQNGLALILRCVICKATISGKCGGKKCRKCVAKDKIPTHSVPSGFKMCMCFRGNMECLAFVDGKHIDASFHPDKFRKCALNSCKNQVCIACDADPQVPHIIPICSFFNKKQFSLFLGTLS